MHHVPKSDRVRARYEPIHTIPYAHPSPPRKSVALLTAGILCFLGTIVPLAWLAIQLANFRLNQLLAEWLDARLSFRLVFIEVVVCTLVLIGLLIWAGVLLCRRSRWAVYIAGAVMSIVLVGATGATLAEAIRLFSDDSGMGKPASENIVEIALRTVFGVLWPLSIVLLLRRPSVGQAIQSRHGTMPTMPVLLFVTGIVLFWYGLSATSLQQQAAPVGIYFSHFYTGTAVTLWRIGYAGAWILAGALLLRARASGWVLALAVTLGAIASEMVLAADGGSSALARRTLSSSDQLRVAMATPTEPNAAWPAAWYRSATHFCLLGLLVVVSPQFLLEEAAEPTAQSEGLPRATGEEEESRSTPESS